VEIHKPKPVHSWRELLTEIGVIVIGVALALAGEQAVEWIHWRSQVSAARQALRAEIARTDSFYIFRIAIAPCMDRRLDEVEQVIGDVAANRKPKTSNVSVRGISVLLSDSEWQSERSAQTLTHFPRQELALMSLYYAQTPETRELQRQEADAWWGMDILKHPDGLGPADLAQLRLNLQIARHHEWLTLVIARPVLTLSDRLGVVRPKLDADRVQKFCTLSNADWSRYLESNESKDPL